MKKAFLYLCWIVTFCAAFASCKPSLPKDVLSKGKMTDILFDYHIALAMAQSENGGSEKNSLAYREAVLKKHDVTSADFDSSMVYYMRHTELLHDVYKDLAERLDKEVVALGGNSAGNSDLTILLLLAILPISGRMLLRWYSRLMRASTVAVLKLKLILLSIRVTGSVLISNRSLSSRMVCVMVSLCWLFSSRTIVWHRL